MQTQGGDIPAMLAGWRAGDRAALDRLLPLIRTELRRLARRHLGRERKNHAMQPSSLVQEAFLRLLPGVDAGWRNRAHFFAVASQVMRHVLVDYASGRRRVKRGNAAVHIRVDSAVVLSPARLLLSSQISENPRRARFWFISAPASLWFYDAPAAKSRMRIY